MTDGTATIDVAPALWLDPGAVEPVEAGQPPELSRRSVALAVARRGGPKVVEANLVPAVMLYICLAWGAVLIGYLLVILWIYGCIVRRVLLRQRVPAILVLGAIGSTVRTGIAIASGSTFVYFAQPILLTVATGALFLGSLFVGRPVIERLAGDFWPISPEMAGNPRVHSLFRGLTLLWAGVNLATAAITLGLLLWLPVAGFVAVKQVSGMLISVSAITATICWSHRVAVREGIVRGRSVVPATSRA